MKITSNIIKEYKSKNFLQQNNFSSREDVFKHLIETESACRTLDIEEAKLLLKTNGQYIRYFNPTTMNEDILIFALENNIFAAKYLHLFPTIVTKDFIKKCTSKNTNKISFTFWRHFQADKLFTKNEINDLQIFNLKHASIKTFEDILRCVTNENLKVNKRLSFDKLFTNIKEFNSYKQIIIFMNMIDINNNNKNYDYIFEYIIENNLIYTDFNTRKLIIKFFNNLQRNPLIMQIKYYKEIFEKSFVLNAELPVSSFSELFYPVYKKGFRYIEELIISYNSIELLKSLVNTVNKINSKEIDAFEIFLNYIPSNEFLNSDIVKNSIYRADLINFCI